MTLTAVFESYEDLIDFAGRMVEGKNPMGTVAAPSVQSVATPVPVAPAVSVQQAPSVTPLVQQPVPTAPVTPPVQQAPVTPPVQAVPTTAPSYTLEDLTRAAIPLMDSGKQPELLQLLRDFGVDALPTLPQVQYGAFATALRGLGAQI